MSTTARVAPERTLSQRHEALAKANLARKRRGQLKLDLKAQGVDIRPLLLEPPEWLLTMKVWDALLALPTYGRVRVSKLLGRLQISPVKTIGGLSSRQRAALIAALS